MSIIESIDLLDELHLSPSLRKRTMEKLMEREFEKHKQGSSNGRHPATAPTSRRPTKGSPRGKGKAKAKGWPRHKGSAGAPSAARKGAAEEVVEDELAGFDPYRSPHGLMGLQPTREEPQSDRPLADWKHKSTLEVQKQ